MNFLALAVLTLSGLVFVEPSRKACNIFGDPNVITFDGLKFKFGGSCTHVLAMDCVDMSWIVYGEFSECGSGTCLEHITVFHNRNGAQDAILIGRGWVINHMGKKIAYKQSEGFQIGHMDVFFDGLYLTITLTDEGVMLTYDGFAGLLITIDDTVNEGETCGLCGNNDGNQDNENDQMREIGNDVKSTGLSGVEALAYQWKVDRGNYCQYPQHISHPDSRRLPCGNDYRKNEEARAACQELVDNQELFKCHSTLDLNIFYEACLVDYCYVDMLTEGYPIPCSTGSAYTKHCQSLDPRCTPAPLHLLPSPCSSSHIPQLNLSTKQPPTLVFRSGMRYGGERCRVQTLCPPSKLLSGRAWSNPTMDRFLSRSRAAVALLRT